MRKNVETHLIGAPPSPSASHAHRLLIIRFSSFGDIVQACGVPAAFREKYPKAEVDWLVRSDFADLLKGHPEISRVIEFDRKSGLFRLLRLAWKLSRSGHYTHFYDAHSNLRSSLVRFVFFLQKVLSARFFKTGPLIAVRPKERLKRWAFFKFKARSVLPMPYQGAVSFHKPLRKWGLDGSLPKGPQFYSNDRVPEQVEREIMALPRPLIALAPSAAWEMKRWPIQNWIQLVKASPDLGFVLLGGPQDKFIEDIHAVARDRALNLAGRLSLSQSCALLKKVDLVIANDTGLLHVADQMEIPTLALIGPTAFGYPSHATSEAVEIKLSCKPCSKDGRGKCENEVYQRCLIELSPEVVSDKMRKRLPTNTKNKVNINSNKKEMGETH